MVPASIAGTRLLSFFLLAAVFLLSGASARAQSRGNANPAPKIVLKVLNGKTGWPIWTELPNVWLGGANFPFDPPPRTNWHGEIKLDFPASGPRELRVLPNWFVDCRESSEPFAGAKVKYSLDEITQRGVVTENVCGKTRAKPIPGTLILYVRPRTFREMMEL
jgi:hypothetical protein